jgi:excisionase family DNA binding protein
MTLDAIGPLLTRAEVAMLFSVPERTVDRWRSAGRLPSFRIGAARSIRFKREDVLDLLRPHSRAATR